MTQDYEFQVFRTWSEQAVREALADFKREMNDGAGVPELQAGLRCLDFLTEKTPLPADLAEDIEATAVQASMRIELLATHAGQQASDAEALQRTLKGVEQLGQMVKGFRRQFLEGRIGYAGDPDAIYAAVRARVRARLETAA